jgi:hypothetical protein
MGKPGGGMNETSMSLNGASGDDLVRKAKEMEKRITKLRNENQQLTQTLEKATRLLEREIGEAVDIEQFSREDSNWRGRAQKLEIYKQKLKKVKMQGTSMSSFAGDDTLSIISETPSVFTGKVTHAEKTLSQMGGNRAKELENVKRAL